MDDGSLLRDLCRHVAYVSFLFLAGFVLFAPGDGVAGETAEKRHVLIFVLENKGFQDIIGNPDAPYLNRLAMRHVLLTDYHALAHPSLPNYAAMLSGRTDGIHSDNPSLRFTDPTIAEALVRKGYDVRGYFQSLPRDGYLGNGYPPEKPLYVVRHNPFYLFPRIRSDGSWKDRVVPLTSLSDDLLTGSLPSLAFVVGDLCHDMHGGAACRSNSRRTLVKAGDRFCEEWIDRIRRSSVWRRDRTVIIVTWDEGRYPVWQRIQAGFRRRGVRGEGGRVPFIVVSSMERDAPRRISGYFDHKSLVRTLASLFHVASPVPETVKPLPLDLFSGR